MTLTNSELDELNELAIWDRLAIQLRESALAQGRPATPPATLTRSNDRAPAAAPAWDLWPPSPQPPTQAMAWPQFRSLPYLLHRRCTSFHDRRRSSSTSSATTTSRQYLVLPRLYGLLIFFNVNYDFYE
jgi:hypothetical protein